MQPETLATSSSSSSNNITAATSAQQQPAAAMLPTNLLKNAPLWNKAHNPITNKSRKINI